MRGSAEATVTWKNSGRVSDKLHSSCIWMRLERERCSVHPEESCSRSLAPPMIQLSSSGFACLQTWSQNPHLVCFLKRPLSETSPKRRKMSLKYSNLDVSSSVFVIEAVLRGQVLRKTSLYGEKCTGNKPKWHWEVHLSAMINGAYASWMGLVPLPRWLALPGQAGTSASTFPAWAQRRQKSRICLKFWLIERMKISVICGVFTWGSKLVAY